MKRVQSHIIALLVLMAPGVFAIGRFSSGELPNPEPPVPQILSRAGFEQKLGAQLPMDLVFKDETGKDGTLREFAGGKPFILNLAYFGCPMLCTEVANGMMEAVKEIPYNIGNQYAILSVSFNAAEKPDLAAAKKANYIKALARPGSQTGWHFLTGDSASITSLTQAVGFSFAWDEAGKQFVHASGIIVATPEGKLSHYFYGVRYEPKDVRLALAEASEGKIGGLTETLLLFCYKYNHQEGKYSPAVMRILRWGGGFTLLAIAAILYPVFRKGGA